MLRGKDIVCISSLDWNAMWTSKHQIMHRLAQTNRVLYVEEPVTMLAPFRVPARLSRWVAAVPAVKQVEAGLWTLTPPPMLPFWNMRAGVNRANQAVLGRYVSWAVNRLGFGEEYILWAYLPATVALLDHLSARPQGRGPSLVVYHCADEYSAYQGLVSPEVVKGYDDELTRRADLVITTAENLRLSRQALNPHTHTVLNAADVEVFNRALDPDLPLPADMAAIPEPRLGVVGMHDFRLDIDALDALAAADPSWQIVLIGPLKAGQVDEARLRSRPNIHLLGQKPRAELPGYLRGLSVALVPYKASELSRNIFPLKLFEYLAAGLPVVVGGLPELDRYSGVIGVAAGSQEYPELVREAIAADSPEKRAARVELAAENTWDHRVEEISALVEEALGRQCATGG